MDTCRTRHCLCALLILAALLVGCTPVDPTIPLAGEQDAAPATAATARLSLAPLPYALTYPSDWHHAPCETGPAIAQISADLTGWCAGGLPELEGLLVGLDVRSLDFVRSMGLAGNPPALVDLLEFNRAFFGYIHADATETELFGVPAFRVDAVYADGMHELALMGFHGDDVFLLGFIAPDQSSLTAAEAVIDAILASIHPVADQ